MGTFITWNDVKYNSICDALRNFVSFEQFKKRENTHGGVLLLVKLQAKSLQLYLK